MQSEQKIYHAYFESKKDKLYFNQIKEITKLSHSSIQTALNKLLKQNILRKEKTKSHIIIQAKKTGFPIYREQNFYEVVLNEYK